MNKEQLPFHLRSITILFALLLAVAALSTAAYAQESSAQGSSAQGSRISFNVQGSVDWIRGELKAQAGYALAQAGIRLPAGRTMAEEILLEAYPRLLRPYLLSLRVDSNAATGDLLERGEFDLEELDSLIRDAEKTPPALSPDLAGMTGRYTVSMEKISAFLSRRSNAAEPPIPMIPVQTADYTGIIIIADTELPIHGRRALALAEPCLFPKIWDTDMNLVYERNMMPAGQAKLMVRYTVPENIFRPTPSGLDGELAALVGPYPLRIIARELFGISPTDPVIHREDALKILSSENNRRLLREGRVVLVLNEKML